jgi:hypothetical protein
MKAGGDVEGIWALFESSIQYVSTQVNSMCLSFPFSRTTVVGHIPYMLSFVTAIVRLVNAIKGRGRSPGLLRNFGKERALKRLQMDASRKDLFYHLVYIISGLASPFH